MSKFIVLFSLLLPYSCTNNKADDKKIEPTRELSWQNLTISFNDTIIKVFKAIEYIEFIAKGDSTLNYKISKDDSELLASAIDKLVNVKAHAEVFCSDYFGNLTVKIRYDSQLAKEIKFSSICDWRKINMSTSQTDFILGGIIKNQSNKHNKNIEL